MRARNGRVGQCLRVTGAAISHIGPIMRKMRPAFPHDGHIRQHDDHGHGMSWPQASAVWAPTST
jgi:hypothetical protein